MPDFRQEQFALRHGAILPSVMGNLGFGTERFGNKGGDKSPKERKGYIKTFIMMKL